MATRASEAHQFNPQFGIRSRKGRNTNPDSVYKDMHNEQKTLKALDAEADREERNAERRVQRAKARKAAQ